ncbi:MFS transporter [Streptomyces sp. ODS28]|uniref:CynX/NimT family MFS transporter n=1 Tax=Streptomyces sp. ODS28 TaxID=3136688 RepID=UPI0031EFB8AF
MPLTDDHLKQSSAQHGQDGAARGKPARGTPGSAARPSVRPWTLRLVVVGMVLAALNLRPAISGLGPLLKEVQTALGMSGTVAGLLTSVPPLCFAVFGGLAPRLARRFGPAAVVLTGMIAVAAGLVLRPFAAGTATFLAATALALAGIAVSNVLMPVVVKHWFPDRVGTMTGLYSMALSLGTSLAAAVTVPMTEALGGSWQIGIGAWAVLGVLAAVPWAGVVLGERGPRRDPRAAEEAVPEQSEEAERYEAERYESGRYEAERYEAERGSAERGPAEQRDGALAGEQGAREGAAAAPRVAKSPTAWALAVFFGLQASAAYIVMGWLPQILRDAGVSAGAAGVMLAVTMGMGVPLSFVLPKLATRMRHQGLLALVLALFGLVGYAGLWFAPQAGAWVWALILGVANCAFPLALTMIGLRARTGPGVAKLSAFAQSTGYLISIPGPLLVGALHDASGGWHVPLLLMTGLLLAQIVAGLLAGRDRVIEDE